MNRTAAARLIAAFAVVLSLTLSAAAPALAQSKTGKPAVKTAAKKKAPTKKTVVRRSKSSGMSASERQARALKRLKDYNYVKSMSPYAGSPNKWGPKW
jgi:hypothetical protein